MKKTNEHEIKKLLEALSDDGAPQTEIAKAEPETDAQSHTNADKEAEFEKLIKGEFKEQFEQRMKNNLARRFKESSALKAKTAKNEQIIAMLMDKLGANSTDELADMIATDASPAKSTSAATDAAERIRALEYENELMRKQREALAMEQTVKEWMKDGEKLKESYPDFSIESEAKNPEFVKLLKAGAGLRNAYLAMHHDEIIKTLVEKAAQEAQEKTAESIRMRGQRPLENGMSGRSTALFKTDVAGLTAAQRAEIAKRVANGEVIRF